MGEVSELDSMLEDNVDETPPHSPRSGSLSPSRSGLRLPALPDSRLPPLPEGEPSWVSKHPIHFVMISLHGLVRGNEQELGRDADTGGQVKYVVELARALSKQAGVHRVDLLTRLITEPTVSESYGQQAEYLLEGEAPDNGGGAYIIRLPAGDPQVYLRKELLWPHLREFADHGIEYVRQQQQRLTEALGTPCRVLCVHGHYADAAEVSTLMAATLNTSVFVTGHSLGKNKLEGILKEGKMTRSEVEAQYRIGRRIEAEERALDHADVVFVSTEEEIHRQWALYSGFDATLERALARSTRFTGRAMPRMVVIPPGLDFEGVHPFDPDAPLPVGDEEPPIWRDIARWLRNPRKPAILAIARPDAKKNLAGLVRAFGESPLLRELANVVIIAGNRDAIDAMPMGARTVMESLLKLTDCLDLWGSIAFPKHHRQEEKSDIYAFAASTRGVFVNCALAEPFGLTLTEAAAHGVPTVATKHGGPFEIHQVLKNGLLVEPTDTAALAEALVSLLTDRTLWDSCRTNGLQRIGMYSWESHTKRLMAVLDDAEQRASASAARLVRRRSSHTALQSDSDGQPRSVAADRLRASGPSHIVCVLMDSRDAARGASLLQCTVDVVSASGVAAAVMVSSTLTVEATMQCLDKAGVMEGSLHAVVADAGGILLLHAAKRQDMVPCDEWRERISWRWLRGIVIRGVLAASAGSLVLSPDSVGPAAGSHCLRFSLAEGATAIPALHVILRRLRRQGIRVHMSYAAGAWELRVLPLRASRALALRYLAQSWHIPLERVVVVASNVTQPDGDRCEMLAGVPRSVLVGGDVPATPRTISRQETGSGLTVDEVAIAAAHVNRTAHVDSDEELQAALLAAMAGTKEE